MQFVKYHLLQLDLANQVPFQYQDASDSPPTENKPRSISKCFGGFLAVFSGVILYLKFAVRSGACPDYDLHRTGFQSDNFLLQELW